MSTGWLAFGGVLIVIAVGFVLGRKSKCGEIEKLNQTISHHKYQFEELNGQAETALQTLRGQLIEQQNLLQKREAEVAQTKSQVTAAQSREQELLKTNSKLHEFYSSTLKNLRNEGALFPAAVRWADMLQESLDQIIVNRLASPPNPAPTAAIQVKDARTLARKWRQQAEVLLNRIDLYESQAPWLVDYAEYSVDEILAGIQEEQEIRQSYATGDDPVKIFLSPSEWSQLSDAKKNQLALDRYWETSRNRSAWTAGIQYERYIGYLYERDGFEVEYHGALLGKEDLGIDLICKKDKVVYVVQCKRLSPLKAIPVRENVVAQIYGSAMFYAMQSNLELGQVKPIIVTTYELSDDARRFAQMLKVTAREKVAYEKYPCIKCNISERTGERIYHLPFDQQYDSAKIGNVKGEFYAMSVAEAEKAKFRRAFKWHGNA